MDSVAILDTNILQYGFNQKYAASTAEFLDEVGKSYDLFTTQYAKFELFRGLSVHRAKSAKTFFDSFRCLDIDQEVFRVAAILSTCYGSDTATKSYSSRFSDGDLILAATSLLSNTAIITADVNDFPRPYFKEVPESVYWLKSKDGKQSILLQTLIPDIVYFNRLVKSTYA